uniref:Uncharacterized protein n=1 Tax=Oryza punctata TaxID=4537 RepID=A0A0E0KEZ9_ORYPU
MDALKNGFHNSADHADATAMYEAGLLLLDKMQKIVDHSEPKSEALKSIFDNVAEIEEIRWAVRRAWCEELVKALEPTLKLLFPSRSDGKDSVQLVTELVPEGPAAICRLSESVANISACHALAVVKLHYPRIDLAAIEEGYAADCFEEDVEWLLGEVAPPAAALIKDLDL